MCEDRRRPNRSLLRGRAEGASLRLAKRKEYGEVGRNPVLQQHIELILPVGLVDQVVAGVVE
jgi:hypothetical protein